jgi:hypothetical protein
MSESVKSNNLFHALLIQDIYMSNVHNNGGLFWVAGGSDSDVEYSLSFSTIL